jgi:nucleoside-triphosphatase
MSQDRRHSDPGKGSHGEAPAILLTGQPGIGKTTVIQKVLTQLDVEAAGFFTREVRSGRRRVGFEIVTLAGETAWLATKDPDRQFDRQARVSSYRVNLDGIDEVAVPAMLDALEAGKLVVVDEVGPMELKSERFREAVLQVLEGDAPILGTIYQRSHPFTDRVKDHPRVRVQQVTVGNRDDLPEQLATELAGRRSR